MHDDIFPAAEKILSDVESIFKKDKNLRDFEILPVTVSENKSPVLHAEHTLGLEEWCVRHLYLHAYHKLMHLRQNQRFRREDPSLVSRLLLGGVLLNPDCTVLWNMRRELVSLGRLDPHMELNISRVTLSRRPKTAEAFIYRRWILDRMLGRNDELNQFALSEFFNEELRVSQMAADRYSNNYHAWNHRMWVISRFIPFFPNPTEVLASEWVLSESWISRHVSEHSGLQYRQSVFNQMVQLGVSSELFKNLPHSLHEFFLPLKTDENALKAMSVFPIEEGNLARTLKLIVLELLKDKGQCEQCRIEFKDFPPIVHTALIIQEILLVTELIMLYPGHEALWSHRRFILFSLCNLTKTLCSNVSEVPEVVDGMPVPKAQKLSGNDNIEKSFLWKTVLWHENKLFEECTDKPSYQNKLSQRHRKWVETVLLPKCRSKSQDLLT